MGAASAHEHRRVNLDEVRVKDADSQDPNTAGEAFGHAAVFNRAAWIGPKEYGFSERFAKGAFAKTIKDGADVRYLFNHNSDAVLARTKSGTLDLSEDATGLKVRADLAPTSVGRDLAILLKRGDVSQMSIGFQVVKES